MGKTISTIQKGIVLTASLSAFLGFVVIGIYLLHSSHLPQDLNLNEVFVLLLVCFSFGGMYLGLLFYSMLSSVWVVVAIHWLKRRLSKRLLEPTGALKIFPWPLSLSLFLFFFLQGLDLASSARMEERQLCKLLLIFFGAGLFITIYFSFKWPNTGVTSRASNLVGQDFQKFQKPLSNAAAVFLVAWLVLPLFTGAWAILSKVAMNHAGIRATNVALLVDEQNLLRLTIAGRAGKVNFEVCNVGEVKGAIVWPVDVLWHGIGSVSLVRIGESTSVDHKQTNALTLQLDRKGLTTVKASEAMKYSCPPS